tara:strand:+ start:779 stop:1144 length:366 start_codon:yes stop_codon:yes gene_type:complete
MSTLKVNNIQDAGGSSNSTPAEIENGRAKAWIRFNGSANTIQASFNVSSISDEGTGKHDVNFTTSFSDANYAFAGMCSNDNNMLAIATDSQDPLADQLRIRVADAGNSFQDSTNIGLVIFR